MELRNISIFDSGTPNRNRTKDSEAEDTQSEHSKKTLFEDNNDEKLGFKTFEIKLGNTGFQKIEMQDQEDETDRKELTETEKQKLEEKLNAFRLGKTSAKKAFCNWSNHDERKGQEGYCSTCKKEWSEQQPWFGFNAFILMHKNVPNFQKWQSGHMQSRIRAADDMYVTQFKHTTQTNQWQISTKLPDQYSTPYGRLQLDSAALDQVALLPKNKRISFYKEARAPTLIMYITRTLDVFAMNPNLKEGHADKWFMYLTQRKLNICYCSKDKLNCINPDCVQRSLVETANYLFNRASLNTELSPAEISRCLKQLQQIRGVIYTSFDHVCTRCFPEVTVFHPYMQIPNSRADSFMIIDEKSSSSHKWISLKHPLLPEKGFELDCFYESRTYFEFGANITDACKSLYEENVHQCSYDLHLINLLLEHAEIEDRHFFPSYLKIMAVAKILYEPSWDANEKEKLLDQLEREEVLMGDVKHNTRPQLMYDLNLFSVPLFLSQSGYVYELSKLASHILEKGDDLEACIKNELQGLSKKFAMSAEMQGANDEKGAQQIAAIIQIYDDSWERTHIFCKYTSDGTLEAKDPKKIGQMKLIVQMKKQNQQNPKNLSQPTSTINKKVVRDPNNFLYHDEDKDSDKYYDTLIKSTHENFLMNNWSHETLFGKAKKVKSQHQPFRKFEVFSIVQTHDVLKFIWVNEATRLIYSGLPSHFTFKECCSRFNGVMDRPDTLNYLRLGAITSANWPLLETHKENQLKDHYKDFSQFDQATRIDAELNDRRFSQKPIAPEEYYTGKGIYRNKKQKHLLPKERFEFIPLSSERLAQLNQWLQAPGPSQIQQSETDNELSEDSKKKFDSSLQQ